MRSSIRFAEEAIREIIASFMADDVTAALFRVLWWSATRMVDGTYSNHEADPDGHIDLDAEYAHRLAGVGKRKWKRIKPSIEKFFEKTDRGYRLKERARWIIVRGVRSSSESRPSISPAMRMYVGTRDNWTCGYCGTTQGPFDIDHIIPLARGGALSDTENLICACAKCNRSKSDKLTEEWIS